MISLRSSLRRSLLTYLFSNRSARFYVRQMAERLGVDATNLSRELARLEHDGFLRSEVEGRQLYYSIDPEYPLLKPLFAMLASSVGVTPVLKKAMREIAGIESAYIYGSFAKNENDAASDIDVLIIGEPDESAVASALRTHEKLLHREINYIVLSQQELRNKLKSRDPFVTDIWSGKRVTLVEHGNEVAAN
jgi:predicted nucleotidyltransferase